MRSPIHRSQPLPTRLLHATAAGAGMARMALRQRTLRPAKPRRRNRATRLLARR